MLFKIKTSFRKEYINPQIEKEIEEKGFSVYNYISLKELFLTVQRDYLEILSAINMPFGVITIILGIIGYIFGNFILFTFFLVIAYIVIFIILTIKLVLRTYYFKKITNVIYTESGIILGDSLHKYENDDDLFKKLNKYEEMFEEFLSKPSSLKKVIKARKEFILEKNWDLLNNTVSITENFGKDGVQFALLIAFFQIIYVIFLYFFYYLGFIFGAFIFFIINIFVKIILKFSRNKEVEIKAKLEDIDSSFKNMKKIDSIIENKINNFKDGEISNISNIIEKNFSNFYMEVVFIFNEKKELFNLINNSRFAKFINFKKLEKYLKDNFNKPILSMISMLEKYKDLLEKQIKLLQITQSNSTKVDQNLQQKEIILTRKLNILKNNILKLEKTIL